MIKGYEITSLPPGFIYITYKPGTIEPTDLTLPEGEIDRLLARGYSGFIVVPEGTTIQSLSTEQLKLAGLKKEGGASTGQAECYACGREFRWSHTPGVIPQCDRCTRMMYGD